MKKAVKPELMWPTPTLSIQHENAGEFNQALAKIILKKEAEITVKGKATEVAGLKSGLTTHWLEYNVLNWPDPEIAEFRQMVLSGVSEFLKLIGNPDDPALKIAGISCWANVLRSGESLEVHHHDPAFVSAHYQVQSGNDSEENHLDQKHDDSGNTVYFRPGFLDRSHGGRQAGPTSPWDSDWRISVPPTAGKLFFFPSYVRHEVRPNMGKGERISIAMDVYVQKQEALIYFAPPRWFVPK